MNYNSGFRRLLTQRGWKQFFKILSRKEKITFSVFLFLFLSSFIFLSASFYFKNTELKPAKGGTYIEGVIGSPRYIQPIYAPANDVDRNLVELIFSGLMKEDSSGKLVTDLAEEYRILEDGKIWEFDLKENLFWSDGKPLTAEDVLFTVKSIQNADTKSPLRANWLSVEVEKISELGIRFTIKNPSAVFLENCQVKIIPEHIWKDIPLQNFPLTPLNLKPVGSGPYKLKNLVQNEKGRIISIDLVRNPKYYNSAPNLQEISFRFFDNESQLIESYKKGEIKGFVLSSLSNFANLNNSANLYSFSLPRYFAVFFNLEKSKILNDKNVRQALGYGTDKKEIVEKVLSNKGMTVDSPILPEIYGFKAPQKNYGFNPEEAKKLLDKAGFQETEKGVREKIIKKTPSFQFKTTLSSGSRGKDVEELQKCLAKDAEIYPQGEVTGYFGAKTKEAVIRFQEKYKSEILTPQGLENGTGEVSKSTQKKLNEICFGDSEEIIPLKFTLVTVNQPELMEVASLLKNQWQLLGAEIEIKNYDISALEQEIIKPRDYEALLFGEVLGSIPDPFPFWHSSQKKDPGLNLAIYENKDVDKLLEKNRQTLDEQKRKEILENFQELLIEDAPAVFLYSQNHLYLAPKEIKGIKERLIADPSKRFSTIDEWYIKIQRAWK